MPPANKIRITIFKSSLLNVNVKLVIITKLIIKSKKLFNILMFNRSQKNLRPFITKFHFKLLVNYN